MKGLFTTAIAIATGLVVLLGYFVHLPLLVHLRARFVQWTIILAGVAVLVGIYNLLSVHFGKIQRKQKNSIYSLFLIFALLLTLATGLVLGPDHTTTRLLFNSVVIPVETTLMALLAITLIYASIRLLRRRSDLMAIIFLISAMLVLLGTAPLPFGEIPLLGDWIRPWIIHVPAVAGGRGILLGVALGTLTTGLRILFGADRPYGGK